MRIGHGLNERIQELCEATDTGKSKVVRWLLEGGVDVLEDAKDNPDAKLPKTLATLHKRRGVEEFGKKLIQDNPERAAKAKAEADAMDADDLTHAMKAQAVKAAERQLVMAQQLDDITQAMGLLLEERDERLKKAKG